MGSVRRFKILHGHEFLSETMDLVVVFKIHQLDGYFLSLDIFPKQNCTERAASKHALYLITSFCQIFT